MVAGENGSPHPGTPFADGGQGSSATLWKRLGETLAASRMIIDKYRASDSERARTADLLRILPKGRSSVLDIGARDGHFSRLLTEHFTEVTALDLQKPNFTFDRVRTVAGNVCKLDFPDNSFDCVFCAEVLEHVPGLDTACREIVRVAKHEIVIGVPFQQDIRLGRTTCHKCGKTNPPWGHINSFTASRLERLFSGTRLVTKSFVGSNAETTNLLSTLLMDLGGNPWGTYSQDEPCIHCEATLIAPRQRSLTQKICSAIAARLNRIQSRFTQPHGNWIHVVFSKG